MPDGLYLRPSGFVYADAAKIAIEAGQAGALAGGPAAFTVAEVIEGAPGAARSEMRGFAELAASREEVLARRLRAVTVERAAVAGLAMDTPRIMGIVNVTPDSFSDGGEHAETGHAIAHARALARASAGIVDIGGESTRPGADPVAAETERARVNPVIEGLRDCGTVLSLDTRKAAIMTEGAAAGAHMLNDVSALTWEPGSLSAAAATGLPVVLMHALGDPQTMQDDPSYADVRLEVFDYLAARIAACEAAGIPRARLVADPGIGFGKTLAHNLALLANLSLFHGLGVPVMLGASRKRFIGMLADAPGPQARVPGSLAAALSGVAQGVQIVRVHDVPETQQALAVWRAVND